MRYYINYNDNLKELKSNNINSIGVIIAHYNEDLDWVDNYFPEDFNIYIYSKNKWMPKLNRKFYHEFLPNTGRCDHTYLYHIIKFYNNLNNFNIFITGSSYVLRHKKEKLDLILKNVGKYHYFPFSKLDRPNFLNTGDSYNYAYTMRMSKHCANLDENKKYNFFGSEICTLIPSKFKSLEDFKNKLINSKDINYVTYFGVFIVTKNIIKNNTLERYKNLIDQMNDGDNLENGHFMERLWAHLFLSTVP